jgi:hypothetical protein
MSAVPSGAPGLPDGRPAAQDPDRPQQHHGNHGQRSTRCQQPGRRTAARPLGRTGKQMNRGPSGDALDHAEKPGGAEQLADRRLRPSRRDHRADYRKQHLSQQPGSIVGGERGRAAYPGSGQAEGQVQPITQQGERHHRPGEPPNGASRHQLTSTRLRRSLRRHQADPADPTRSSFWTVWLASSTAQSGADTRSRTARSCRGQVTMQNVAVSGGQRPGSTAWRGPRLAAQKASCLAVTQPGSGLHWLLRVLLRPGRLGLLAAAGDGVGPFAAEWVAGDGLQEREPVQGVELGVGRGPDGGGTPDVVE